MRVSFLAVLAVALLVGLGAVVAIKSLGLLAPPPQPALPPQAPIVTLPPPMPRVLVLIHPMFEGDVIGPADVGIRAVTEAELKHYKEHQDEYLMGEPAEAFYRFVARDLPGNKPLMKSDLQPVRKSDPLHDRLLPGTRAVNVAVSRDNSAGWLVSTGDWVDVHLVTNVSRTDNPTAVRREGLIVRNAHVIAKRDSLVTIYSPVRGDTYAYTLSMNPYRASLLEYARTLGEIMLVPVSKEEKARLDALLRDAGGDPAKVALITVGDPNTREGMEEQNRVNLYTTTGLAVGTDDLARSLQLKPLEPPTIAYNPVVEVEVFTGTSQHKSYKFQTGRVEQVPAALPTPEYIFSNPLDNVKTTPNATSAPAAAGATKGGYQMVPGAPKGGFKSPSPPR